MIFVNCKGKKHEKSFHYAVLRQERDAEPPVNNMNYLILPESINSLCPITVQEQNTQGNLTKEKGRKLMVKTIATIAN